LSPSHRIILRQMTDTTSFCLWLTVLPILDPNHVLFLLRIE
jgi:hypothetical protein